MSNVFLGIGSNIERERYVTAGLDALQRLFGELAPVNILDNRNKLIRLTAGIAH